MELPLGPPGASSVPENPEQALGDPKGWYRRFLPHRDEPGTIQFIK